MSRPATASRRSSRQAALQALYAVDVGPRADLSQAMESLARVAENFEIAGGARAFADDLVAGVVAEREAIDEAVELARRFGDDGSPRFVNGVLGALIEKDES